MRRRYVPPAGSIPTLEVPDLGSVRRLHLIGIGGAGMRNLARLFPPRGSAAAGARGRGRRPRRGARRGSLARTATTSSGFVPVMALATP